ncbi:hypothetical protein [Spirillospora sp. NPDC048819]|uniref:hypothetical protein n=1 Tax=Spirillospora sp. NPDC048819 TaxID=3155268 RepID=UPI0034079AB5
MTPSSRHVVSCPVAVVVPPARSPGAAALRGGDRADEFARGQPREERGAGGLVLVEGEEGVGREDRRCEEL